VFYIFIVLMVSMKSIFMRNDDKLHTFHRIEAVLSSFE